jgi:hypothetical protein
MSANYAAELGKSPASMLENNKPALERILTVTAVDWNVKTWSLRRPVLFLEAG